MCDRLVRWFALLLLGAALPAQAGQIVGTVSGPGGPLLDIELEIVRVVQGQPAETYYVYTDATGHYASPATLADGDYHVRTANYEGLVDEAWPDAPCAARVCAVDTGAVVTVAGGVVSGIDFALAPGARILAQVTLASGAPLADALVQVSDEAGDSFYVYTLGDGSFDTYTGLPPGPWYLAVSSDADRLGEVWQNHPCSFCSASQGDAIDVAGTATIGPLDIVIDEAALLSGTITAVASGSPVAGASISVFDADHGEFLASAVSGADGKYTTSAFVPGNVRLYVDAPGFLPASHGAACEPSCQPASGAPVAAAPGMHAGYDVAMFAGSRITGTVVGPDGNGVAGVTLRIDGPAGYSEVAATDAMGHYATTASLPPGAYRLRSSNAAGLVDEAWPDATCLGGQCDSLAGAALGVALGQDSVADFVLGAGTRLSGHVGAAADGAPVQTQLVASDAGTSRTLYFTTDVNGDFDTGTGLPDGAWHLVVFGTGDLLGEAWHGISCQPCTPGMGSVLQVAGQGVLGGLEFALDTGVHVAGTITDAQTHLPLAGASVYLYADDGTALDLALADAAGHYTSGLLSPGTLRLVVSYPGYVSEAWGSGACTLVPCGPGASQPLVVQHSVSGIDFALTPAAAISGRVTAQNGTPMASASVEIIDAVAGTRRLVQADASGVYLAAGLLPGSYHVIAHPGGSYVRTAWPDTVCGPCTLGTLATLTLAPGEALHAIDVVVPLGGRVGGTVSEAGSGAPIAGVSVFVEPIEGEPYSVDASTQADGSYLAPAVLPGQYRIGTLNSGMHVDQLFAGVPCPRLCDPEAATPVVVGAANTVDVDFVLIEGGKLSAKVLDVATQLPLPEPAVVQVLDAAGVLVTSGMADAAGDFVSAAIAPGNYYLRTRNRSGYLDEWFLHQQCFWCLPEADVDPDGHEVHAAHLPSFAGGTYPSVDFRLAKGARFAGTVVAAAGAAPVTPYRIDLYDAGGRLVTSVSSTEGAWQTPNALPPGVYHVVLRGFGRYADQLLGGAPCAAGCDVTQGTPVTVTNALPVSDIDFEIVDLPVFVDGFEDAAL